MSFQIEIANTILDSKLTSPFLKSKSFVKWIGKTSFLSRKEPIEITLYKGNQRQNFHKANKSPLNQVQLPYGDWRNISLQS